MRNLTRNSDLSLSTWQRLRDTELIAKARLLHRKLTEALASDAAALADYDLTPADATLLAKELADFEEITADPAAAISRRRALTVTLRPRPAGTRYSRSLIPNPPRRGPPRAGEPSPIAAVKKSVQGFNK